MLILFSHGFVKKNRIEGCREMWTLVPILTLRKRPTFPSFVASNRNICSDLDFAGESDEVLVVSLDNSSSQKTCRFWHAVQFFFWCFCVWVFLIFWLFRVVGWIHLSCGGVSSLHLAIFITSNSVSCLSSESSTWLELDSPNRHIRRNYKTIYLAEQ